MEGSTYETVLMILIIQDKFAFPFQTVHKSGLNLWTLPRIFPQQKKVLLNLEIFFNGFSFYLGIFLFNWNGVILFAPFYFVFYCEMEFSWNWMIFWEFLEWIWHFPGKFIDFGGALLHFNFKGSLFQITLFSLECWQWCTPWGGEKGKSDWLIKCIPVGARALITDYIFLPSGTLT